MSRGQGARPLDREALRSAVSDYLPQILRAARGAGLAPDQAEEVTQRTFTTFIETADRFEGRSSVRTWLFGILYRKILELRRELARSQDQVEIDAAFDEQFNGNGRWLEPPRPADAALVDREVRQQISACLDTAPERQKMAFLLREVEEFSSEEICEILGISRTNLGVTLHRVRNRLRQCLTTRGIASAS